jgi:hypothetical protein
LQSFAWLTIEIVGNRDRNISSCLTHAAAGADRQNGIEICSVEGSELFQEPRALLSRKPDKTRNFGWVEKMSCSSLTSCFWFEFTGFLFLDDVGWQCVTE